MRVAFVHDYLTQLGGAERVLLEMHRLFCDAPIYTSLFDRRALRGAFDGFDVRTTWMQRIPFATRNFRAMLPLYPAAFESIDLSGYDLVISSTSSFAKGVRVGPDTLHVSYVNTPTRFVWLPDEYAFEITSPFARPLLRAALPALRRWDLVAAHRPHRIIANSAHVARRIREFYGRTSDVLHGSVDLSSFAPSEEIEDYFLVIARLLPYKRVALAVEACNAIGAPLIVVGAGPDEPRLRRIAGPAIRFAGYVNEDERRRLLARARAVIVPGTEDFGLVPLEAAASGRPTIAFAAGGALETVVEGETGLFFRQPDPASLAAALRAFSPASFRRERLVAHADAFSPDQFRRRLSALIERYLSEFRTQQ